MKIQEISLFSRLTANNDTLITFFFLHNERATTMKITRKCQVCLTFHLTGWIIINDHVCHDFDYNYITKFASDLRQLKMYGCHIWNGTKTMQNKTFKSKQVAIINCVRIRLKCFIKEKFHFKQLRKKKHYILAGKSICSVQCKQSTMYSRITPASTIK